MRAPFKQNGFNLSNEDLFILRGNAQDIQSTARQNLPPIPDIKDLLDMIHNLYYA